MTGDVFVALIKTVGEFLVALTVPVVIAAPLIAILVDQVFKRLPIWKDGYAGWANLVLNIIFSGGLFIAARMGAKGEYEEAIRMSIYALPIVIRLVAGVWASFKMHKFYKTVGVGKSITEEKIYGSSKPDASIVGALG